MTATLKQDIERLRASVDYLEAVVKAWGITGVWVSINQAASLLGVSPPQLRGYIERAEEARLSGKKPKLAYGTHYRNIAAYGCKKPTWQVNFLELQKWMNLPPELKK